MNNNVKAIKSGVWYTAATFLTKGISFITTPIFARILDKTQFGLFSNYVSCLTIVTIIVTLNLESTLISARYEHENEFDSYILSMMALSGLSCIVWTILILLFKPFFIELMGVDSTYINIMIIYLFFSPAISLFLAREAYLFEYKKSAFLSLLISLGTAVVSVALVLFMNDKLKGRILGSAIPTIIVGAFLWLLMISYGKKIQVVFWKYAIPICLPFIPHLLSLVVLSSIDRIMITKICGPEDNAIYSLAYSCAMIITMLLVAFNNAFAPWLGNKLHLRAYDEIRIVSKKYMIGFTMVSIGVIMIAPEIIGFLGGNTYSESVLIIPPIAAGCMIQFIYGLFVNVEQFEKKTIWMAIASVSAAILNYLLNGLFIPRYGYTAAAYTTFVGYLWLLIMHMVIVWMYGYRKLYSYSFVMLLVFLCFMVMLLGPRLLEVSLLRYFVIGVYFSIILLFAYSNKKSIMKILRSSDE